LQSKMIELENFVDFLSEISNKNMSELSKATGISLVTFHNWKNGIVTKLNYKTRLKLGQALEKYKWGFHITSFGDNQIIVEVNTDKSEEAIIDLTKENQELKEVVYKQSKEIIKLQETLEKYEVKK